MRNTNSVENPQGHGLYLYDTGILIEDCQFMNNESGGVYISNTQLVTGDKQVPEEIRSFLEKFPMIIHLNRCDIINNDKSGVLLEDWWKGPVIFQDCKLSQNKHSGIIASAVMHPHEQSLFKSINKTQEASSIIINGGAPIHPRKQLQQSVTTTNMSNGKVVPSNIFNDESKIKTTSNYQNPMRHLMIGTVYLYHCTLSDNKNHGLSVVNVPTDCNNCQFSANLAHAINLADEDHYQMLKLRFSNCRSQLQGTVGGTWGVMQLEFKENKCAPLFCCGSKSQSGNAILTKKVDPQQTATVTTVATRNSPRKSTNKQAAMFQGTFNNQDPLLKSQKSVAKGSFAGGGNILTQSVKQ